MHLFINTNCPVMHKLSTAIHNLKKFFALKQKKCTDPVYKDFCLNILPDKKPGIVKIRLRIPFRA